MGVTRASWRPTVAAVVAVLHIAALIGAEAAVVTGTEGQRFDFRCDGPGLASHQAKCFCGAARPPGPGHLGGHNRWEGGGGFSLYDNTSGALFSVRLDHLEPRDGGTYVCSLDVLNGSNQAGGLTAPPVNEVTALPTNPPDIDKLSFPLYLTAVACVSAMLFVCVFTGLLLAVKSRRPGSSGDCEMSSDYESMTPGARAEPEWRPCSDPCCAEHAGAVAPRLTSKRRESAISLSLADYVGVDPPQCLCQYQDLDPSSLENHVYHSLEGDSHAKHEEPTLSG